MGVRGRPGEPDADHRWPSRRTISRERARRAGHARGGSAARPDTTAVARPGHLARADAGRARGSSGPRSKKDSRSTMRGRRATGSGAPLVRSTIVQVTNLGISVKDSPQNTLIFVTRLDTAAPVAGARVAIVKTDGIDAWKGHDRRRRRRDRPADAAARSARRWYQVRVHRHGREGRRRRLRRQRLERRDRSVGVRAAVQPRRGRPAAARHRLHRSRRLPARARTCTSRRSCASNTATGIQLLPAGTRVAITTARRAEPRRRRAHGHGQCLEQRPSGR